MTRDGDKRGQSAPDDAKMAPHGLDAHGAEPVSHRFTITDADGNADVELNLSPRSLFLVCNQRLRGRSLAERVALFKALSEGARRFTDVAVVTAAERPTPPCGACRQLLWEYCGDVPVHLVSTRGKRRSFSLGELLPYAFDKRDL